MATKTGNLSIHSENIFPIIKKWLYSDHDIFMRELISNGCDAITKLKKLDMIGEFQVPEDNHYSIQVSVSPENKTLTFTDNGIGMTAEEVEEYINQIAFSGAEAFLEQYKDKTGDDQIIGHFGLGFYSAFMVADKVTIDTLSYREGAAPVHWECDGGTEYSMEDGSRTERGTEITLYLNEDSTEFSNEYRAREVIKKYCSFMPEEIYLTNLDAPEEEPEPEHKDGEDGECECGHDHSPKPLNDTTPLWTKHPNDCTDEEYKEFYRNVFLDFKEPLFWIHLNMDYPFNLKGILYFPQMGNEYESLEGTIKLYNNQVFIADNIKEVIPEFLLLLKGTIDCPDLPLNVSRSALQNDGFVKKISDYITKKVADKLSGMCKTDREAYEKYWDDISPFIKFGCLKDQKFNEKMKDYILFRNLDDAYLTLPDYLEAAKEKHENKVFYVTDAVTQASYIQMFRKEGMDAVMLTHAIDTPFITYLEQNNTDVKFLRIDADISDIFKDGEDEEEQKELTDALAEIFRKALGKESLSVKAEKLKDASVSSLILSSEEGRRTAEMMKMYGMSGMDPAMFGSVISETLVLNANNALVQYVKDHPEGEHTPLLCQQLYDLAMLANQPLSADAMTQFLARSNEILGMLIKE